MKAFLSVRACAKKLGLRPKYIHEAYQGGRVAGLSDGDRFKVRVSDVLALAESKPKRTALPEQKPARFCDRVRAKEAK